MAERMRVEDWLAMNPLSASDIDCITAIQLKILDGKCKMPEIETTLMAELYEQVKHRPGQSLDGALRDLIAKAKEQLIHLPELSEGMRLGIYELRLLAESTISRPVMKAFKSRLRETRLLPKKTPSIVKEAV